MSAADMSPAVARSLSLHILNGERVLARETLTLMAEALIRQTLKH